ncbi:MAG TPA: thiamine-phosphate pyrophosphorylase [Candidatus Omnitrophica bacterium]|nr:thiamine-phosphate pyrophosphorylase [Candidatus Omnitrophota bacterium]
MRRMKDEELYRVMDANLNRAKEGLRVCEDICRFVHDHRQWTRGFKTIRHQLTESAAGIGISNLVAARHIEGDVGRKTLNSELARRRVDDIFYANAQRVKESIRVLEEFAKLKDRHTAEDFKKLRYRMYALEKRIITQG